MPNSSVLGLLGDPTLEEEFRRLKKRDLTESYLFKMACGSSRPLKCRNTVISKQMVDKRNAITCRPLPRNFSVLPDTPASENRCASLHMFTHYPGKKPEEHPEWVSERKAFRQALDGMGDLRRWLHSKPILTDMEVFITQREGQAKMMSLSFPEKCNYPSPPDAAASPCALKHEVEEVKRYLRTFKLLACNLSKYLDWHGTGKIKRADLHVMFEKEGFLLQPERLDALMSSLNSMDGNSVTVVDLAAGIQAWSTKLKDREEQRTNSGMCWYGVKGVAKIG
ncbi:uncharacterized protein si:dkey-197j19.5 [Xyrauchen texanus]|uniref:uncharacterized protein si:dkey-197j19.5 n=1 Tax=Xyrauchen texanus TaxID=154827 RepID=UPI0022420823|nr:uncharacterized protein si:dkey-197j19.5 [Xyrauchen texanus]